MKPGDRVHTVYGWEALHKLSGVIVDIDHVAQWPVKVRPDKPAATPDGLLRFHYDELAGQVDFSKATVGDHAYTYKQADGEPVAGDYGWVADLDYFDERSGEVRLIRQEWRLIATEEIVLPDPHPMEDE